MAGTATDEMDDHWSEAASPALEPAPAEASLAAPAPAEAAPAPAEAAPAPAEAAPAPAEAAPAPAEAAPAPAEAAPVSPLAETEAVPAPPAASAIAAAPAPATLASRRTDAGIAPPIDAFEPTGVTTLPPAAGAGAPLAEGFGAPHAEARARSSAEVLPPPPPVPTHPVTWPAPPPLPRTSSTPVAISEADLTDDLRPPSLLQALSRSKPNGAWSALGVIALLGAFASGLATGRVTAPLPLPPVPVPAAPSPVKTADPAAAPELGAAPVSAASTLASSAGPSGLGATASAVAARDGKPAAEIRTAPASTETSGGAPFNAKAAKVNLGNAAVRARHCHVNGDPKGTLSTEVTFGASGRVAEVTITTDGFAKTKTAQCVSAKLGTALVPPFGGQPQTVTQTVALK
ncbi:MAG TPA: hypothetical protein VGQ57_19945 [Polyangiaceae bacterium]|nr:hypothetical protein [Polyangiaceae bacterium]